MRPRYRLAHVETIRPGLRFLTLHLDNPAPGNWPVVYVSEQTRPDGVPVWKTTGYASGHD